MCAFAVLMAGIVVSAQIKLPSVPPKQFGASVTPSYDGWFFNADGSQTFLVGYFNRNTEQEVDIPIGPNNHFEPGEADLGQPTHFLTRRRYGMFVVPIPKSFGKSDQLWWSLTFNGVTNKIPMHTKAEYTVSPFTSTEESPGGGHNTPPVLRFEDHVDEWHRRNVRRADRTVPCPHEAPGAVAQQWRACRTEWPASTDTSGRVPRARTPRDRQRPWRP